MSKTRWSPGGNNPLRTRSRPRIVAPGWEEVAAGITGTGSLTTQSASASGIGERSVTGTGALSAQSAAASGVGERVVAGTGSLAPGSASVSGAGTVGGAVATGTGALAAQAATVAGVGERAVVGTGALAAQVATVAGAGSASGVTDGAGALVAGAAVVSGAGERSVIGTGALAVQAANVAGAGSVGAEVETAPQGGGGWIAVQPRPKRKRIEDVVDRAVQEAYEALRGTSLQPQAAALVAPHVPRKAMRPVKLPPLTSVDWAGLTADVERVEALMRLAATYRRDQEDEELLLLAA